MVAVIGAGILLLTMWHLDSRKSQERSIERLVDLASLGIIQQNRQLLEATLQLGFYELRAKKIIFCKNGKPQISYPITVSSCGEGASTPTTRLVAREATGMPEYKFWFYIPLFSEMGSLVLLGIISGIFLLGGILTLRRVYRKVGSDLLRPLMEQIQSDTPLGIKELEELRLNNRKLQALRTKEAITEAVLRHNAEVAHDLRDPLGSMDKLVAAVVGDLPAGARNLMKGALNRMKEITHELLEQHKVAKALESANADLTTNNREVLSLESLKSLIIPIVEEKKVLLQEKCKIGIEVDIEDDLGGLLAHVQPNAFKRVVSNLITNAVEAIETTGKVVISLGKKEDWIVLGVSDNGRGIPQEVLPLIGREGFSYGKDSGNGLGLHYSKKVVEVWGGSLNIRSTPGVGTRVQIGLPIGTSLFAGGQEH
jgi:signal transduction histidine kinase